MVGVENLWTPLLQCLHQHLNAEVGLQGVGRSPGLHLAAVQVMFGVAIMSMAINVDGLVILATDSLTGLSQNPRMKIHHKVQGPRNPSVDPLELASGR